MKAACVLTTILCAALLPLSVGATGESDRLQARAETYRAQLERDTFRFSEADAGVLYALRQFGGKCQVHMIYDPGKWGIMFRFVRGETELVAIQGHEQSTFRTDKDVLYFAHFLTSGSGCAVTAHDLGTGKKLWETKLKGVPPPGGASAYTNEITMGVARDVGVDAEGEGIVSIRGRESYGDYVEILDRATGTALARKVYREGYRRK